MDDRRTALMPRQRGLTLVELLLGLAILGTLVALAPPLFARMLAAESDLAGLLASTWSAALMRNTRVTLCRSVDGHQCAGNSRQGALLWQGGILFVDLDQDRVVSNDKTGSYVANFTSAAAILWNRGDSLVYQPDGTALGGSNGTFTIRAPNAEREHHVVISMLGRVRVVR